MRRGTEIVAVIEPPDGEDPYWTVEAPAIHYQAQGRTRREALALFEQGLAEATAWAVAHGARLHAQPEIVGYPM